MPQGLPKRIRFAFVMQALLASALMVLGILVVNVLGRNLLVDRLLATEADAFWQADVLDPEALPRSSMIRGWFVRAGGDASGVPAELRSMAAQAAPIQGRRVLVQRRAEGDLYLSLSTGRIDRIALASSVVLAFVGLVAILLVTWLTYQRSRRMVLPLNQLADVVSQWDPGGWDSAAPIVLPHPLVTDNSKEMRALSSALSGLAARISDFVQRERDFTRDASHELRTPLTVIRVAADMMEADPSMSAHARRSLHRVQQSVQDMEALVDAFLILARERGVAPQSEDFQVDEVVREEVEKVRTMLAGKDVALRALYTASPRLFAPPRVLGVMVGHLLRNACIYTDQGAVEVEVLADAIQIRDTGIGMSADTLDQVYDPFFRADPFSPAGKGIGLTVVRRLGDRFGWPVSLESAPGKGTVATIGLGPSLRP